jgi:hypothetical protein
MRKSYNFVSNKQALVIFCFSHGKNINEKIIFFMVKTTCGLHTTAALDAKSVVHILLYILPNIVKQTRSY